MKSYLGCKWKMRGALSCAFFLAIAFSSINLAAQSSGKNIHLVNGKIVNRNLLNSEVENMMKEIGIPGLALAIINKGEVVFYNTYGQKNLEAKRKENLNRQTIFEGCSMSKSFLVYAAYKLVDQGVLDLDRPLFRYLEYDELKYDERYRLITARMVLSHSSGIENHKEKNNPDTIDIVSEPGESFVYSGEGYIYLSKVIEKLLNKPVERYLKEMVYEPLGLKRTYTTCTGNGNKNFASGHSAFGENIEKERNTYPDIAGRIQTNAMDYAKLMSAIVDGRHISDKSLRTISTPVVRVETRCELYYGAGFEILITPRNDTILIQGGDNNGYKGMGCYSITQDVGFVFYVNAERGEGIGKKLCELATGLDIGLYYDDIYHNPYPNTANQFFRLYKQKGAGAVKDRFDQLMTGDNSGKFTGKDVLDVVYHFKDKDYNTARYIAKEYQKRNPDYSGNPFFERWFKD